MSYCKYTCWWAILQSCRLNTNKGEILVKIFFFKALNKYLRAQTEYLLGINSALLAANRALLTATCALLTTTPALNALTISLSVTTSYSRVLSLTTRCRWMIKTAKMVWGAPMAYAMGSHAKAWKMAVDTPLKPLRQRHFWHFRKRQTCRFCNR